MVSSRANVRTCETCGQRGVIHLANGQPNESHREIHRYRAIVEFRSQSFHAKDCGAYIQVFQRPGEEPMLDLNFFEGNREIELAESLHKTLEDAIALAKKWKAEKVEER